MIRNLAKGTHILLYENQLKHKFISNIFFYKKNYTKKSKKDERNYQIPPRSKGEKYW